MSIPMPETIPYEGYVASPEEMAQGTMQQEAAFAASQPAVQPVDTSPPIEMLGPDGSIYRIPSSKASEATQQGFKLESPEAREARQVEKEHPWMSALHAWQTNVMKGATFGLVNDNDIATLAESIGPLMGSKLTKEQLLARIHESDKSHPYARWMGDVTGMILSIPVAAAALEPVGAAVLGAGAGSLIARGGLAALAGRGAIAAAEGAALAAPKAIREAIEGDPGRAAETVAWGAGGNMLFAGALGLAGKGISKLGSVSMEEAANNAAFRAQGDTSTHQLLGKEKLRGDGGDIVKRRTMQGEFARKDLPQFLQEDVFSTEGRSDLYEKWFSKSEGGKSVRDIALGSAGSKAEREAMAKALADEGLVPKQIDDIMKWREKAGVLPNEAITFADSHGVGLKLEPIIENLNVLHGKYAKSPVAADQAAASEIEAFSNRLKAIMEQGPESGTATTFETGMGWRRSIDDSLNWSDPKPVNRARIEMRNAFDSAVEGQMGEVATAAGDPKFLDRYNKGQEFYQKLVVWEKGLAHAAGKQMDLRATSLTDNMWAIGAATAGAATGDVTRLARGVVGAGVGKFARVKGQLALSKIFSAMPTIETSMKGFGAEMMRLPQAIEGALPGAMAAHKILPAEVFSRFSTITNPVSDTATQAVDTGKDKAHGTVASYVKLADEITKLSSDPVKLQLRVQQITDDLMKESPQVAAAVAQHYASMIRHLAEVMPKYDNSGNPYAPVTPSLSTSELQTFAERLAIADDPHMVQHFLSTRTLKAEHMDTLFKVWPSTYRAFVERMQDHAMSGQAKPADYQAQIQLSLLTGVAMNHHMKPQTLLGYQKMYTQESMGGAPGLQGVPKRTDSMDRLKGPGKGTLTTAQRIEGR